jgi:hypothetical protein
VNTRLDSWRVGSAMAVERTEGKVRWVSAKPQEETICHVCWLECHKSAWSDIISDGAVLVNSKNETTEIIKHKVNGVNDNEQEIIKPYN